MEQNLVVLLNNVAVAMYKISIKFAIVSLLHKRQGHAEPHEASKLMNKFLHIFLGEVSHQWSKYSNSQSINYDSAIGSKCYRTDSYCLRALVAGPL